MSRRERRPYLPWPYLDMNSVAVFEKLDAIGVGAVVLLAGHAWANGGHLDDDPAFMQRQSRVPARYWNVRVAHIKDALAVLLPFLRQEYEAYENRCKRNQDNIRKRWDSEKPNTSGNTNGNTNVLPDLPSYRPTDQLDPSNRPTVQPTVPQPKGEDGAPALVLRTRTGTPPRITVRDLTDDRALRSLNVKARKLGWISESENDREKFFAAVACALRRAKASSKPADPGDVWVWIVHGQNWDAITDEDYQAGHDRRLRIEKDQP